jgi:hypothetical protein
MLSIFSYFTFNTMSNWYYYNEQGEKIAVTGGQLKGLAKAGMITPGTMIETEDGKKAPARKVKGLTFGVASPPTAPKPLPSTPSDTSNPFTAKPQTGDNPFTATMPPVKPTPTASVPKVKEQQPPVSGYDFKRIASAYRLSSLSIVLFVSVFVLQIVMGSIMMLADGEATVSTGGIILLGVFGLYAIGCICFSIFCIVRLASSLQYKIGTTVFFALCFLFFPLWAVPSFHVYFCAGSVLKQAGYRLGRGSLLGINMQQFDVMSENYVVPQSVAKDTNGSIVLTFLFSPLLSAVVSGFIYGILVVVVKILQFVGYL